MIVTAKSTNAHGKVAIRKQLITVYRPARPNAQVKLIAITIIIVVLIIARIQNNVPKIIIIIQVIRTVGAIVTARFTGRTV